jgi:signal transduction histidine kinase
LSQRTETPSNWSSFLRRAFDLIILGILLTGIVSLYVIHHTQREVEAVEARSVASITFVFRLSREIEVRRRLFDAHVVETSLAGMNRIEAQLGGVDARIAAISRDYQPTIDNDAERDDWQQLQAEIAAVRPNAKKILALSRQNRDTQARQEMKTLDPQFDAVDRTMDDLVRMNSARAMRQLSDLRALRAIVAILLMSLIAGLMILALFVARWATRLIEQGESQLREANSELEERNRELDAFAGRVAHDLRGPLTAINLAVFAKEGVHEERATAIFRRGVKQMEAIIQDLLTLSRISAETAKANCQVSAVVASAEEDLRQKVQAAEGVLLWRITPATVPCSEGLLRQVLWNLVENAVKYRRSGVRLEVEVRGRIANHSYELTVSDNGMGISPSEAQHAFEPFFRGENVRSTPGTGLGLSIAKRVVEASSGSVSIESRVDQGTTFKIRLPLAAEKAA